MTGSVYVQPAWTRRMVEEIGRLTQVQADERGHHRLLLGGELVEIADTGRDRHRVQGRGDLRRRLLGRLLQRELGAERRERFGCDQPAADDPHDVIECHDGLPFC